MPARIAVLGAPGTGKTRLSHELAEHLRTRGHRVVVVTGALDEDAALGAGIVAPNVVAADVMTADIVVADTPADAVLLHAFAVAPPRSDTLTLLMGLDLPEGPDATLPAAAPHALSREQSDAHLRVVLTQAGIGWRVIYGQGEARVRQALDAVAAALPWAWRLEARDEDIGRWSRLRASCETCGDAACEHRLFTGDALGLTAPPT